MTGWVLLALALSFAQGHLLVKTLWPLGAPPAAHRLLRASLAMGLGLGLSSFTYFGWLLLANGVGRSYLVADLGLLLALAGTARLASWRSVVAKRPPSTPNGPLTWLVAGGFVATLCVSLASLANSALFNPHGGWDAWAIWNLRARFFFRGGSHWSDAFTPSLAWSHPDYPLMLPLSIARLWSYSGVESHWAPVVVGGVFTYAAVGLIVAGIWLLRGRLQGLLTGMALMATPVFMNHGASQYADIPLSYFFLGSTILLCLAATDAAPSRGPWMTAGVAAGLAAWTKNEGLLFLVCTLGVQGVLLVTRGSWRLAWRRMAAILGGLLIALPCLLLFKLTLAPPNDLLSTPGSTPALVKLLDGGRHLQTWEAFHRQFEGFNQGAPWFLIVLLIVTGIHRKGDDLRALWGPLLTLGGMLGGYHLVYVLTPHDLAWHLSTSLDRLFIQLWPLALLVVFVALDLTPLARKRFSEETAPAPDRPRSPVHPA